MGRARMRNALLVCCLGVIARIACGADLPAEAELGSFGRDTIMQNGRVAVVFRRGEAAAGVYSLDGIQMKLRALVRPDGYVRINAVEPAEADAGGAAFEVTFAADGAEPVRLAFSVMPGQPFVETRTLQPGTALRVEAPCRFVVLPDFFADDIVIDATELPVDETELPVDNFLLQLLRGRDAILMTVLPEVSGDVAVELSGQGPDRTLDASVIPYGKDGRIWLGLLTSEGIWHRHDVMAADRGSIVDVDWTAPYPAMWRLDWRRSNALTDSWSMAVQQPDGTFVKYGPTGWPGKLAKDRQRWTTVLHTFTYPCWIDTEGRAHLQPLDKVLEFEGPALIYPINRVKETPLDQYTVVDLVRSTLGVGPCEYVLDVEGQGYEYRGMATCGARDRLDRIYKEGRQRQEREAIERALVEVMVFVRHIRGRIESYREFGLEVQVYLEAEKLKQPELREPIAKLQEVVDIIEQQVAARREAIKTADQTQAMADEFAATLLDYEGADAYERCKEFTSALVNIGSNQDELVGECRWTAKMVRQRAGLAAAADPRMSEIAREIRRRAQAVLRNAAGHEGVRH